MSALLIITGTVRKIETVDNRTTLTIPEDVYRKDKDNRTEWHRITLWGKDSENAAKNLRSGSVVSAHCNVSYTKDEDNNNYTNFNVYRIEYLANFGEPKED